MTDQSIKADYKNGDSEDEVLKSKHHPKLNLKHSGFKHQNIYRFFHASGPNIYTREPHICTYSYSLWHLKS